MTDRCGQSFLAGDGGGSFLIVGRASRFSDDVLVAAWLETGELFTVSDLRLAFLEEAGCRLC